MAHPSRFSDAAGKKIVRTKKITGGSHNSAQDDFNPGNSRKIRLKKRRILRAVSGADIKLAKSEFFP